jgi:starch-binding outer membrane protein, SusD/RagB family
MKSFIYKSYLIIIMAVSIGFTSCIKEKLKDTPTPDQITNETDVTALINGMYSRFNDAAMFKFQGMLMLFVCADDLYSETGAEFGTYSTRVYNGVQTAPFWNQLYASIAGANDMFKTLDRLQLDSAFEQRAYGEAHFIRGFCYYYLVRLYGGVPLRLDAVDVNSNFYLPRTTLDETYAQIFSDFQKASAMLPRQPQISAAQLGRASKGAAQALLAQAYLTYGNQLSLKGQSATNEYTLARTYADSVLLSGNYTLLANYGDLFDITKETSAYNEVIFGIRFQTDQQARAQPAAGSEFALRFGASNTHFVAANGTTGAGDASMRVMPWVGDYYRTGDYITGTAPTQVIDYRNEKAFFQKGFNSVQNKFYDVYPNIPVGTNGSINTPLISKYIDPSGKDSRNHGNDLFIIRLAEVYLIKAEAENELNGPTAAALAAFNAVRARARAAAGTPRTVPANITAAVTKDQFRIKIFDERGLELIAEGGRWFDLVRMCSPLSATQTMYEYQFKTVFPTRTTTLPVYQAGPPRRYSTSFAVFGASLNVQIPKFLLFPVPVSEITQNSNFGLQNPGW